MKAREFERELAHIRDEFERLRLAYEGTRTQLEAMEVTFLLFYFFLFSVSVSVSQTQDKFEISPDI